MVILLYSGGRKIYFLFYSNRPAKPFRGNAVMYSNVPFCGPTRILILCVEYYVDSVYNYLPLNFEFIISQRPPIPCCYTQ
jgi:hypothetical protein